MKSYASENTPGRIVAARREELSFSQAELARKLDYPNPSFISMMEAGKSRVPVEKATEIANALEMDPTWFTRQVVLDRYPELREALFGNAAYSRDAAPSQSGTPRCPSNSRIRIDLTEKYTLDLTFVDGRVLQLTIGDPAIAAF